MGTSWSVDPLGAEGGTDGTAVGEAEGVETTARAAPATFFTTTLSVSDATSNSATSGDSLAILMTARIWSRSSFGSVTIASRGQGLDDPADAAVLRVPSVQKNFVGHLAQRLQVSAQPITHDAKDRLGIPVRPAQGLGKDFVYNAQVLEVAGGQLEGSGRIARARGVVP